MKIAMKALLHMMRSSPLYVLAALTVVTRSLDPPP